MIALLNDLGGSWLTWVLDRGIAAGLVFACVAAIALLLRRGASAHAMSWLWLLPLVPLVAPVERLAPGFEIAAAPRPVIERWVAADAASARDDRARIPGGAAMTTPATMELPTPEAVPEERPVPEASSPILLPGWLFLGWGSVALVLFGLFLRGQLRWRRMLSSLKLEDGELRRRVLRLARRTGVGCDVRVAMTDVVASPATSGWMRPVILLPRDLPRRLSRAQLDWVLLHELAHVRRCDLLVLGLQRVVQIAWWFHPIAWIANAEAARHRECACDDAATAHLVSGARSPGAKALFEVVAAASGVSVSTPELATLVDQRSQLRRRMMRMLDGGRTFGRGLSMVGALGVVVCAGIALTVANAQQPMELARIASEAVVQETVPTDPAERAKEALRRAVSWLVKHQEKDGRWTIGSGKDAAGMESELSLTARSVLALNEADGLVGTEASRSARDKAVRWMESSLGEDGQFGEAKTYVYNYGHALAMIALCGEQRRAPSKERLALLKRGVSFTVKVQNPYSGWRYGVRDGDNDSKMTALMLMGLRAAQKLGVEVPTNAFKWGEGYLGRMVDPDSGRVGWVERGGPVGRLAETYKSHPPEHSEEVTALALDWWLSEGALAVGDKGSSKGIGLVSAKIPRWSMKAETVDYAHWYWGTRLLRRVGGSQRAEWTKAYLNEVMPKTRWLADGTVTWPLDGGWCLPGLEAYVTAIQVRTLVHLLAK